MFFPDIVKDYINSTKKHVYTNKDRNINISITSFKVLEPRSLVSEISKIYKIHDFVINQYGKEAKEFSFKLILTPFKKHIKLKGKNKTPLDVFAVNSGYTDFTTNEICIWRSSEWDKVFMHELIHLYKLEKCQNIEIPQNIGLRNNFRDVPLELFCELQTWYLYCIFYHLDFFDEIYYSIKNVAKILKAFNINNFNDFVEGRVTLTVNSSVAYYFIYKGILLYNFYSIYNFLIPQQNPDCQTISAIFTRTLYNKEFNDIMNKLLNFKYDNELYFMSWRKTPP